MKLLFVLTLCLVVVNAELTVEKCLEKNSLTCLQSYAYREIRKISDQDSIPVMFGLELVRGSRGARSAVPEGPAKVLESEEIGDVEKREEILEQFVISKVTELVSQRSLTWNIPLNGVASAVRSLAENLPKAIAEGRDKKLLKTMIPFILGMKLKVVGFLMLSYLGIAFLAKQAMVAAVLALAVSALGWFRHLFYPHAARHPQFSENHLAGLPSFGHSGLELGDAYSAHPGLAQGLAYASYKPFAQSRR